MTKCKRFSTLFLFAHPLGETLVFDNHYGRIACFARPKNAMFDDFLPFLNISFNIYIYFFKCWARLGVYFVTLSAQLSITIRHRYCVIRCWMPFQFIVIENGMLEPRVAIAACIVSVILFVSKVTSWKNDC